jgi:hypothetical protein
MWTNEQQEKKSFEAHEQGAFPAVCVDIFEHTKDNDNYMKPKKFKNDEGRYDIDTKKTITSVCVSFMTSELMEYNGKMAPRMVSFWAPKTWHEKGNLRKFVAGWIPAFAADDNFDEEQLIGRSSLVNVVQYTKHNGYTGAKVGGAMPIPKGMDALVPKIPADFIRHKDKQEAPQAAPATVARPQHIADGKDNEPLPF